MRGVPARSLWHSRRLVQWRDADGLAVVLPGATTGYGGGPQAAGHRGRRARQLGAPGGLPPKGRDEKLPPRNGEPPGVNPSRLRRVTLAAHSLATARARPRCSRLRAVRPGAPEVRP
jgi:hypothetical protein